MSGIRKNSIKLADVRPHHTYMIRNPAYGRNSEFIPVSVVCDFTHGWLRGWVKMNWDSLWYRAEACARFKYITVKAFDGNYTFRIEVERIGDAYYCQNAFGITLFQYQKDWFERKRNQIREKIADLQRELEALSGVDPEQEQQIQRLATMREQGLYA
jgi:hypothetical protein